MTTTCHIREGAYFPRKCFFLDFVYAWSLPASTLAMSDFIMSFTSSLKVISGTHPSSFFALVQSPCVYNKQRKREDTSARTEAGVVDKRDRPVHQPNTGNEEHDDDDEEVGKHGTLRLVLRRAHHVQFRIQYVAPCTICFYCEF